MITRETKAKLKDPNIQRAYMGLRRMRTIAALYFANGKLSVSYAESRMHERRLETFKDGIVGVYTKSYEFDDVVADIEEFLKNCTDDKIISSSNNCQCAYCDKKFSLPPSKIANKGGKFCGRECTRLAGIN